MKKILFFLVLIFLVGCVSPSYIYGNGTFVANGTDEYYYLQSMDYNKKHLIEFYDLQRVIEGNFCNETYGNYITDITPQSFRLQCCEDFVSNNITFAEVICKNYVIINKQVKELEIH